VNNFSYIVIERNVNIIYTKYITCIFFSSKLLQIILIININTKITYYIQIENFSSVA